MKHTDASDTTARLRGWGDGERGEGGRRGGSHLGRRVFGQGGLRLALLELIARKPAHGYELIKAIGEMLNERYAPSPGVLYPTLTWLEELGYIEPSEAGAADAGRSVRKRYQATASGRAHLAENRPLVDALLARMQALAQEDPQRPPQVERAIHNFKMAVHMRLARGPLDERQIRAFAQVLDAAAQNIENL